MYFRYLAETSPQNLLCEKLYQFSDELFVLLDWTLSNHFLLNFGGLFNEKFYGLVRKERSIVGKSVLVHVLLPYIKVKVDRLYERWIIQGSQSKIKERSDFYHS